MLEIQKKVSHITLVLDEVKGAQPTQASRKEAETKAEATTPVRSSVDRNKKPGAISDARRGRLAKSPAEAKQFASAPKTERALQRFFRRKAIG